VIFTWSQGFLSSASSAVGTEQGAQNIAAQSQIIIENVIPNHGTDVGSGDETNKDLGNFTLIIRNVGSVTIDVGSITIQGIPENAGFKGTITITVASDGTLSPANDTALETGKTKIMYTPAAPSLTDIAKGDGTSFTVSVIGTADLSSGDTRLDLQSGDFITVKVTTTVGSFAQYSITVP